VNPSLKEKMKKALLVIIHTFLAFLLGSLLWVTGHIDYSDYVVYKGLLAIIVDYWREFAMVVIPLSILCGWRGLVNAHKMRQKTTRGLRMIIEIGLMMAALNIIFATSNFYYYGAYKDLNFFDVAPIMVLEKLIIGGIFGIVIGFCLFLVNVAWVKAFKTVVQPEKG